MNEDDWRQIILPAPILIRALVLSVVGSRWAELAGTLRGGVVAVAVLALALPLIAAARYTRAVIVEPEKGHEFVDNRAIGSALAGIPLAGSVIVTNDLRYPADEFRRDNRQLQIPALFGHQAFAVNYQYETYPFSPERMKLQQLLQADRWTPDVEKAARTFGWTHFLVRNDYPHPAPIPLHRTFDSGPYSVYRFSRN
jgi:hypothetical protein